MYAAVEVPTIMQLHGVSVMILTVLSAYHFIVDIFE